MRNIISAGCLATIAILALAQTAAGQIVLTRSSIEGFFNSEFSVVTSMSYDEDKIIELLETMGADQTWDFTGLDFEYTLVGDGRIQTSSVEGTPGKE